jgi:hypothetical protein
MATGKSPGLDGFPAEFYQRFWPLLGQDYVDVMNYGYSVGRLSASQRSGVITLLHKRGDRLDMKNWRPITLLCVDYKIAAKVIANRLLQVIQFLVHDNQSCGVPGRNPILNNRLLKDIVSEINRCGLGGAILSLDQEKAFDRVEWPYLQRVLERMNFGESFQSWVRLFYTNIFSCVLVNGMLSDPFKVTRGVRQGCPLSPLLYVLIAETLACAIRSNPLIDGYPLPRTRRVKLCQYADDTSIVVMSDAALREVFSVFERYESASGAKLNVRKSHGLLVGTWTSRSDLPVAMDWSTTGITVMGSILSNVEEDADWDSRLSSLDSIFSTWQERSLSFHGRAMVANTLGLSIFWYLSSFLCMPATVVADINKRLFPFVWQKKREWLARSSVIQRFGQGGLGVVDVKHKVDSLHVLWVRHLVSHPDLPSLYFFKRYLTIAFSGMRLEQILQLPSLPQSAVDLLPPFYHSVMSSWFRLSRSLEDGKIVINGSGTSSCPLESLSAKFVYREFSRLDRKEHRCVAKYHCWGLTVDWRKVWLQLHLWRFIRPVRDTSWLIAHGILPTADRLFRFGMAVDPSCHCGQAESLLHLFTQCPTAKRLLAWYQSLVRRIAPQAVRPTPSQVLVGYGSSVKLPPVFPCLLGVIRHQIWVARNGYRFEKIPVVYRTVLSSIKSSLRFTLRVQHRHCPRYLFSESWLAGGVFGFVSPDDVIVFPEEFW